MSLKRNVPDCTPSPPPTMKRSQMADRQSKHDEDAHPRSGNAAEKPSLGSISINSSDDDADEEDVTTIGITSANIKVEPGCEAENVKVKSGAGDNQDDKAGAVLAPSQQGPKREVEVLYVYDSDEEDAAKQGSINVASVMGKAPVGQVDDVGAGDVTLLGLHEHFVAQTSQVHALLSAPVGKTCYKLTDLPEDAGWYGQPCLTTVDGRPVVIVAIGTLHFVHLQFARIMLPSLSVVVELFREADQDALQRLFDLAEPRHKEAARRIEAFRGGHDEQARLLNVYDCIGCLDPEDEGRACGINELVAGDVVRVVIQCDKVVDDETGRMTVEFKLRKLDLLLPVPRLRDIKN